MQYYPPSDVCNVLKIKTATLRKYSLLMEKHGYTFQKNEHNQRFYRDEDIITLRKIITAKNNGDTLENAVK